MPRLLLPFLIYLNLLAVTIVAQNSMVGDGFGGRSWYKPTNYTVGSYSAYSICYDDSSQLYGWGSNGYNQLGLGVANLGVDVPTPIPYMTNVKFFSTGYNMGAIKNDNTGWVWGSSTNPIQVISNAYFLDASSNNISFVKTDGTVWSLGDNAQGVYGDGTANTPSNSYTVPTQMISVSNAVRVANNPYSTIVLLSDSSLVSCGSNLSGNLGLGSTIEYTLLPLPISGLPKIIDIKSTTQATIALTATGDVYVWGIDYVTGLIEMSPFLLPNLQNIIAISGCDDGYHFLALDENKNCYGWGADPYTFGSSFLANAPQLVATNVIDIMAGETFSYIVKTDGSLWATGYSTSHSIWLNLPLNTISSEFIQIDPSLVPEACPIVGENISFETNIHIPNVFTPNGDGENDDFYFPNKGLMDISWQVFNRWGNLVFETNTLNHKWDGKTMEGKDCSDGTYYYVLNYSFDHQNKEKIAGFLTLMR
jgi:gliding motility-associated-like protein